MPANGETVTLPTSPSIPVGVSLGLLKREMAQGMQGRAHRVGAGPRHGGRPAPIPALSLQGCFLTPKSPGSCMAP